MRPRVPSTRVMTLFWIRSCARWVMRVGSSRRSCTRRSASIGIGEPQDISLGGLRVINLPACPNVKIGDHLGLLLLDGEDALSLEGEVIHHSTPDTFGVEFRELSNHDQKAVGDLIGRLHARL